MSEPGVFVYSSSHFLSYLLDYYASSLSRVLNFYHFIMGQPESKPQQQNGFRSGISSSSSSPVSSPSSSFSKKRDDTVPKSTKKKKQNTQEAIPYTSYSIPKQERYGENNPCLDNCCLVFQLIVM
jgi:hypothetical protein